MDLSGLLSFGGGGGGTSKEFGRSSAESNPVSSPVYGARSSDSPAWLWPAIALAGAVLLSVVLISAIKKL